MKIVEFKDGTFAVRRWVLLGYEYKSLASSNWWGKRDNSFNNCKGTREQAEREFNRLTDHGKPVKASPNARHKPTREAGSA
jgi:hypothetical protein